MSKQKLVILIQMLIWLNDARALSNSGIHEVFEYLNLKIPSSKSVAYRCFSSYVKKLVFSKNYIIRLIDELKKLEIEINKNENFKQVVNEITGKCNELLNESKYKRKIKREYLVDQLYAINKIVEISMTNNQFLNPESNYEIYLSIDKIEDQVKHERQNFIDLFKKIKLKGKYHVFDKLSKKRKQEIDETVEKLYNEFRDDKKNYCIDKSQISDDQHYIIQKIKSTLGEHELPIASINEIYLSCNPVGKSLTTTALNLHWIRDKANIERFKEVDEERKEFINKKVSEEYQKHLNETRKDKTRYSEEMKYVVLSLKQKKVMTDHIYETISNPNSNIPGKQFKSLVTFQKFNCKSKLTQLSEINNLIEKQRLDALVEEAVSYNLNRSNSLCKYPDSIRYFLFHLKDRLTNKIKFNLIKNNSALFDGKQFSTEKNLTEWIRRNKNKLQVVIKDVRLKAQLDNLIRDSIEKQDKK